MTEEELIESAARPKAAWQLWSERMMQRRAVATGLLVFGLIAGSLTGYFVGRNDPMLLSGISAEPTLLDPGTGGFVFTGEPFEPIPGPPPMRTLTTQDVSAIGENVTQQVTVLIGRSALPVLCGISLEPDAGFGMGAGYSSTRFHLDDGILTQLVWMRTSDTAASGILQTLAFQAQQCPDLPDTAATLTTSGVLTGIGDEYAVFHNRPNAATPGAEYSTVVLVRVGSSLIEISFSSTGRDLPDAESRSVRAAIAAVKKATGG